MLTRKQIEQKMLAALDKSITIQNGELLEPPNNKGIPLWFIMLQLFELYNAGDRHVNLRVAIRNGACGKLIVTEEKLGLDAFPQLLEEE